MHERFLSQTRNTVNGMLWRSKRTLLNLTCTAVRARRELRLDTMLVHLYSHTGWMGVILLAAGKSQWIGPALVKKLAAVKDDVEVAAAATMMYKENDNKHGALLLLTRTRHANSLHTYVKLWTCMERAELWWSRPQ